MPLVEIILGEKTNDEAIARSLDYIQQIRKTPIVVNDSRGFYTSRVFSTFTAEGIMMLAEGVKPALIENAAKMAGMPVGPLAVTDEVTLELAYKIGKETAAALGQDFPSDPARKLSRLWSKHWTAKESASARDFMLTRRTHTSICGPGWLNTSR